VAARADQGAFCFLARSARAHPSPRAVPAATQSPTTSFTKGRPRRKKKTGVPTYLPFLRFFEIFRSDFRKCFYGVFGLLMQRNGQKGDKTKSMGKDDRISFFSLNFFRPKVFDMYFPKKVFYGAFELPLLRNAQKRHNKKKKKKKKYLPTPFSGNLPDIRGF
jgi:hypothetical protein